MHINGEFELCAVLYGVRTTYGDDNTAIWLQSMIYNIESEIRKLRDCQIRWDNNNVCVMESSRTLKYILVLHSNLGKTATKTQDVTVT